MSGTTPPRRRRASPNRRTAWITRFLNRRFLRLPKRVEVLVREHCAREQPGSFDGFTASAITSNGALRTRVVELSDAIVPWWVLDDDRRGRRHEAGLWASRGHAAAVFDDELYEVLPQTRGGYAGQPSRPTSTDERDESPADVPAPASAVRPGQPHRERSEDAPRCRPRVPVVKQRAADSRRGEQGGCTADGQPARRRVDHRARRIPSTGRPRRPRRPLPPRPPRADRQRRLPRDHRPHRPLARLLPRAYPAPGR